MAGVKDAKRGSMHLAFQFNLYKDQQDYLAARAKEDGVSMAEVLRTLIDEEMVRYNGGEDYEVDARRASMKTYAETPEHAAGEGHAPASA